METSKPTPAVPARRGRPSVYSSASEKQAAYRDRAAVARRLREDEEYLRRRSDLNWFVSLLPADLVRRYEQKYDQRISSLDSVGSLAQNLRDLHESP